MYKILISILFGLLCLTFSLYSINLIVSEDQYFHFLWSLIFPTLIALSWGKKYGIISLTIGLGVIYSVFTWQLYGAGNIAGGFSFLIWIILQGYGAEKRVRRSKIYNNKYAIHLVFVVIHLALFFIIFPLLLKLNQFLWPNALQIVNYRVIVFICFNEYINLLAVLAITDVLLLLPFVRRFFLLSTPKEAKYNTPILVCTLFSSYICLSIIILIERSITSNQLTFPDIKEYMSIVILTVLSIASAGIIIKFSQKILSAQEQIKIKEAEYYNIFDNINDVYYELSLEGTILIISPSIKNVLGYSKDELIGKNISSLLHEPESRKKIVKAANKEWGLDNYEIITQDKWGGLHNVLIKARSIINKEGLIRIIGTGRDVTDYLKAKKAQEKVEQEYKVLFDKMLTGFAILEPVKNGRNEIIDFKVVNANPAANKQTKIVIDQLIGLRLRRLEEEDIIRYEKFKEILQTGESLSYESSSKSREIHLAVNVFKIGEDQLGVVFNNITPYKQAISQIIVLNEELENRVKERTQDLYHAISEIEVFSYTISHDLKSPLRAIDAYSGIILEDFGGQLEVEGAEMINQVRKLCCTTIEMINKLQQYSLTSKLLLIKESVDIESVFIEIYTNMKAGWPEREIILQIPKPLPIIMGDIVLMRQVVDNVLSNAIKFTSTRTKAIIEVGFEVKSDAYLFYIKDNGVGFNMAYSDKLFGLFERLHSINEFEGSGIGLATIQRIIQKHGGEAMIKGEIDKGATLYFTIPLR